LYFELIEAFEFIPSNDEKPFAFVQEIFNERARIVDETKRKVKEWKKTSGEPHAGPRPPDTEEDALKKWEAQVEKLAEIHGGPKPYDIMEGLKARPEFHLWEARAKRRKVRHGKSAEHGKSILCGACHGSDAG
jgi:hypothetical protein